MARRMNDHTNDLTRSARRAPARRRSVSVQAMGLKPIALAALLLLGGGPATAGIAVYAGKVRPTAMVPRNLVTVAPGALPVPLINWRDASGNLQNVAKSGNTTGVLSTRTNADGSTISVLDMSQGTDKAIVQFGSFNIGRLAELNLRMNGPGASALWQVSNTAGPSQIYGALNAGYIGADGVYRTGGDVFLINQNGILFGKGAQVNVGGLIASALNMKESDFLNGMRDSIQSGNATFFGFTDEKGVSTYAPSNSFVQVEQQANITTSSGGRVFLLGGQVQNDGTITTPNGQTVLASGREVYLSDPTSAVGKLYMSEANANVPTVKGLLVEVNGQMTADEFATNTGTINTPTGNATIVGWAVNQKGRISATTSVTQNGSVYLLARSGVQAGEKKATKGGTLTLDQDSRIDISPDASGTTVAANSVFTASRVELSGRTIELASGSRIVAAGGNVNVRAEATPQYTRTLEAGIAGADTDGHLTIGANAVIDVAGTTDTSVSVARHFVKTELLGAQDLKDSPLQKDGPIYRSELTFDIREAAPILGDTKSYTDAVQKSAGEFLSKGGNVVLASTGDVVTDRASRLDVSGGQVSYTAATVAPSVLVAENGQRYTLNTAPSDVRIVAIQGKEGVVDTRFGAFKASTSAPISRLEAGYVDGQSAGALSIYAPVAQLNGQIKGSTVVGARQKAGKDAKAKLGTLNLGAALSATTTPGTIAVLQNLKITQRVDDSIAQTADGDQSSHISAAQINEGGFGNLVFSADGGIEQQAGANLVLPDQAALTWVATGAAGVTMGAGVRSAGGSFTAAAKDGVVPQYGGVTVRQGSVIDMSGNWVNQRLDGTAAGSAVAGGSIKLLSDHALVLEEGSRLNVSGGVTVTPAGAFVGTKAGSIALEALNAGALGGTGSDGTNRVHLGAQLQGFSLTQGGALSIKAGDITVSDSFSGLSQGQGESALNVGSDFFSQGGFQSIKLNGRHGLTVKANSNIQARTAVWLAQAAARNAATGSDVARLMSVSTPVGALAKPVSLSFSSTGVDQARGEGRLSIESGARIAVDPLGSVSLSAAHALDMDGAITAKGGTVNIGLDVDTDQESLTAGTLVMGDNALVDVSGGVILTPTTSKQVLGTLYDGGTINVGASAKGTRSDASIDIKGGAQLIADGGEAQLDVARNWGSFGPAYSRKTLASNGGHINIQAGAGGARLAGSMYARGGNATALGGTLTVGLDTAANGLGRPLLLPGLHTLHMQDALVGDGGVTPLELTVSSKAVEAGGFANLYLSSQDQIAFSGEVNLALPGHLRLNAPTLLASDDAKVNLSAASTVQLGNNLEPGQLAADALQATNGKGRLSVSGGLIELFGQQSTKGLGQITLASQSELRLRGLGKAPGAAAEGAVQYGAFHTQADLDLSAEQVVPTTMSDYTINAPGKVVTVRNGHAAAQTPLSGGAALTINAAKIKQLGVIKVPFGSVSLNATDSITLGEGSLTSVSGEGMLVPFGNTLNGGTKWQYNDKDVTTFTNKAININADGQTVNVQAGATLNMNGGGNLVGFEFVPGPGGSKNIFAGAASGAFAILPTVKGYAAYDQSILGSAVSLDPAMGNALGLGNTVTFGKGGPVPAGTYAILPASYALLPGAFLIKANSSVSNVGLGFSSSKADGSYVVAGITGTTGMAPSVNATAKAFTVMSSDVARRYSEVTNTYVDDFLTSKAAAAGTALPPLSADAGRLSIIASKLQLDGQIQFEHARGARGGQLDIASNKIHVGDTADTTDGVLNLRFDQLNRTQADSIMLGGVRQQADETGVMGVSVSAQTVTVDASSGQALSVGDLILAAQNAVAVNDGVQIKAADSSGAAPSLKFSGDGALLRVSKDATASSVRERGAGAGTQGQLLLGKNLTIEGGSVTAEGTLSNRIDSATATSIKADKLVLGANRIELGRAATTDTTSNALSIDSDLAAKLTAVKDLTLRSFSSVDLYGAAQVGGDAARAMTLDASSIRVMDAGSTAQIKAGQVALLNTTGQGGTSATAGTSTLQVVATGLNGGTGHVTIGPGQVALSGVRSTAIDAAGSVVMSGQGGLTVPGQLTLTAQTLTATQAADSKLSASGAFSLNKGGNNVVKAATAGAGAQLAIAAQSVSQAGNIVLPSGKLSINAEQSVGFGAASTTNLAGVSKTIDGQALTTLGGVLNVTSAQGDISLAKGGVLDVSAGLGKSTAGSMAFSAVNGSVKLDGQLLALSKAGQQGGALSIDARNAVDLKALAQTIADKTAAGVSNFAESIQARNRTGDQQVLAGTTLASRKLVLSADNGNLSIGGTLLANGDAGGLVSLSAMGLGKGNVTLTDTADVQAKALSATGKGGVVEIEAVNGHIDLAGGSIDTSGAGGNGSVSLRAEQTETGVAIKPIQTALNNVARVDVEAVARHDLSDTGTLSPDQMAVVQQATSDYLAASYQAAWDALTSGPNDLSSKLHLRAGVEFYATGDLTLSDTDWGTAGLQLTGADRVGGEPVNWTFRAGGNLNVSTSLSEGFNAAGIAQSGEAGRIRLIGGADLGAARLMTTAASADAGDVVIGDATGGHAVAVRNTTGRIDVAAGRDVVLLNAQSTVYTTGETAQAADTAGYTTPAATGNDLKALFVGGVAKPFLTGGGSISIQAQNDVLALTDDSVPQFVTEWALRLRNSKAGNQLSWWNRYDKFKQGFATFGGGNVDIEAGRDAWNVNASASSSGYVAADGVTHSFGGGSVSVKGGRDVIGGVTLASVDTLVEAGRDVTPSNSGDVNARVAGLATPAELEMLYGDGASTVRARHDLTLGHTTQVGLVTPTSVGGSQAQAQEKYFIYRPVDGASVSAASTAGDVLVTTALPQVRVGYRPGLLPMGSSGVLNDAHSILPGDLSLTAANGAVSIGQGDTEAFLVQVPSSATKLSVLARDEVTLKTEIQQFGANVLNPLTRASGSADMNFYGESLSRLGGVDRTPTRFVSELGDVSYKANINLVQGVRVIAGRDIVQLTTPKLVAQHQTATELSLLQAGRDILLSDGLAFGVDVRGPGDVIVASGRNTSLGGSQGIEATGNLRNSLLPKGSASITMLTGVDFTKGDISDAANAYYQLLGGKGVGSAPALLYTQIMAQQAESAVKAQWAADGQSHTAEQLQAAVDLAVQQAEATAKSVVDTAPDLLTQARTLAGDEAYQQAVYGFVNHRVNASLTASQAVLTADALSTADRSELAGQLLAKVWAASVPEATRQATAIGLAQASNTMRADKLQAFVVQRGLQAATLPEALKAFAQLPVEQQALFITQSLTDEVGAAISEASKLTGSAKQAANDKAYRAMSTVFPNATSLATSLNMGSSQVKTYQDSPINVYNPNGGVNVGELTAASAINKTAADLGLVTAGGGDLSVLVRDNLAVNTSRVFTLLHGDETLWSSLGNIDAGKGAKTASTTPTPVYFLDANGQLAVDTSSSITGGGIVSSGGLLLAAPKGEINAGDAGIKANGEITIGGGTLRNSDAISGKINGGPPAPAVNLAVAAPVPTQDPAAGPANPEGNDSANKTKKRKRNVLLDFLGFGTSDTP